MITKKKGLFQDRMKDPEYRRLFAQEYFIEDFLNTIDATMKKDNISRRELAKRLKCSGSYITLLMNRSRNLSAAKMSDIAHCLGLELKLDIKKIGS